ncbi:unnamed protein product [Larinioides sclopetarius]|uniref:Guanine nucleotide-binding protein subunit beta-like protein 1 n=1 Tax=Larinioides sclopetarius TaxID=280406 RepID=A0AAV2AA93_9ARAC
MSKLPSPPIFVLRGHGGCVTSLHFTDEVDDVLAQPSLISGSQIGEIFVWNLKTFRTQYRIEGHDKTSILYLNYYKSSLISHGRDGNLNVWNFLNEEWTVTRQFQSPNVGFCASVFYFRNNEPHLVLFNDDTHTLGIYNYKNETEDRTLKIKEEVGMCMCMKAIYLKENTFLLTGYESGHIGLWDCESDDEISQLKLHDEPVMCLDYDTEHKNRGVSGSVEKVLETWTIKEDFTLTKVQAVTISNAGINAVKIREDGKILMTGGSDSNIRIFSWKSLKLLALLDFHEMSIHCLSCSCFPVGKQTSVFASGSKDKCIALWSIY